MDDLRKPILPGKGASDYERYLRTDELLSLQKLPEEFLHKDELTFQVVHQASELLLKGAAWELERTREYIAQSDFADAARLLRRANHMLEFPISLLHVLETITPYDYHLIRAGLGHGSGLDSPGFLALLHIGPRLGEAFHEEESRALEHRAPPSQERLENAVTLRPAHAGRSSSRTAAGPLETAGAAKAPAQQAARARTRCESASRGAASLGKVSDPGAARKRRERLRFWHGTCPLGSNGAQLRRERARTTTKRGGASCSGRSRFYLS